MNDTTFKYLFKNNNTRNILMRIIKYYVGIDLSEYEFIDNELNSGGSIKDFRLDIILVSKDKKHIVNIEMNKEGREYTLGRNRTYLHRIAGNILKKKENYDNINEYYIEQVNFNNFYAKENKEIEVNTYKLTDLENNLTIENFKIHNIYIPKVKEICYNEGNEVIKLFTCESYEEMRKIAKDNEEMNMLVSEIERLNKDEYFGALYNIEEEQKLLESSARSLGLREGRKKGLEEGIELGMKKGLEKGHNQGVKDGILETAKRMKDDSLAIDIIMQYTNLSKKEIEKL